MRIESLPRHDRCTLELGLFPALALALALLLALQLALLLALVIF